LRQIAKSKLFEKTLEQQKSSKEYGFYFAEYDRNDVQSPSVVRLAKPETFTQQTEQAQSSQVSAHSSKLNQLDLGTEAKTSDELCSSSF
jgi:hypothetical protein